jgi:hypothetical protein
MKKFSWSPHRVSSVLAKTGFLRESPRPIRRPRFLVETMDCASIDTRGHACVHSIDAAPMTAV